MALGRSPDSESAFTPIRLPAKIQRSPLPLTYRANNTKSGWAASDYGCLSGRRKSVFSTVTRTVEMAGGIRQQNCSFPDEFQKMPETTENRRFPSISWRFRVIFAASQHHAFIIFPCEAV
jgi:hypothetical protein